MRESAARSIRYRDPCPLPVEAIAVLPRVVDHIAMLASCGCKPGHAPHGKQMCLDPSCTCEQTEFITYALESAT